MEKVLLGGGAGGLHGRNDAPACARDFLVARALEPQLELVRTVAGIDEMRVAGAEARHDPRAARIVLLARGAAPLAARPDPADLSLGGCNNPVRDCTVALGHGCEIRVDPDGIVHAVII